MTFDSVDVLAIQTGVEPNESTITLKENSPYRKTNIFLDWHDSKILAMRDNVDSLRYDSWSKAKNLTKYVYEIIERKNLSISLATSSEVASRLEGDCTEHAILLATLLRVVGLPSRVACGLQYMEEFLGKSNVWCFHMWT